ncbi:polysaccharide deacetylase family protein [Streptomyces beijiangensis]|uniref:Polysaccharide deacetylase family protein n=1 Tax=Streptomyces beijiangensis TaxID=163361 RepID=A0A939F8F2_9ACTN|nr:polysaccharide deacetylase family protein [Streptomyces beijiangensis]MBO0514521.1 polysaccharide deacetylase family protein [Streptomyces beijiangensis]
MITLARRLTAVAALGAALTACGSAGPQLRADKPAPVRATSVSPAPPRPSPSPAPTAAAAKKKPPRLAPGPGGLTPVFSHGSRAGGKVVALTFDADMTASEGPRAAGGEHFDNPRLIADLRRLKVPATIFMTGRWADEYPGEARSIGADPLFEVANHSYSHYAYKSPCYGLPELGAHEMRSDAARATAAFRRAGVSHTVPYFRFPGGCYDDAALHALAPLGMTAVQWDVVSGDPFAQDSDAVAEQVLSGVRPGSLVVMHCTESAAPATDAAVRRIVPELRARGYRFVKVSDLMGTA